MGEPLLRPLEVLLGQIRMAQLYAQSAGPDASLIESTYLYLLGSICSLTEEEADFVEPAFTALEWAIKARQPRPISLM